MAMAGVAELPSYNEDEELQQAIALSLTLSPNKYPYALQQQLDKVPFEERFKLTINDVYARFEGLDPHLRLLRIELTEYTLKLHQEIVEYYRKSSPECANRISQTIKTLFRLQNNFFEFQELKYTKIAINKYIKEFFIFLQKKHEYDIEGYELHVDAIKSMRDVLLTVKNKIAQPTPLVIASDEQDAFNSCKEQYIHLVQFSIKNDFYKPDKLKKKMIELIARVPHFFFPYNIPKVANEPAEEKKESDVVVAAIPFPLAPATHDSTLRPYPIALEEQWNDMVRDRFLELQSSQSVRIDIMQWWAVTPPSKQPLYFDIVKAKIAFFNVAATYLSSKDPGDLENIKNCFQRYIQTTDDFLSELDVSFEVIPPKLAAEEIKQVFIKALKNSNVNQIQALVEGFNLRSIAAKAEDELLKSGLPPLIEQITPNQRSLFDKIEQASVQSFKPCCRYMYYIVGVVPTEAQLKEAMNQILGPCAAPQEKLTLALNSLVEEIKPIVAASSLYNNFEEDDAEFQRQLELVKQISLEESRPRPVVFSSSSVSSSSSASCMSSSSSASFSHSCQALSKKLP